MNKFIGIGRLTRAPELKTTASGLSVCSFDIAINRRFRDEAGEQVTDFFHIITWRGLADNCAKYLNKGSRVAVCGNLQNRSYEDRNGVKRTVTEVCAEDVDFLSSVAKEDETGQSAASTPQSAQKKTVAELEPVENDGLPF